MTIIFVLAPESAVVFHAKCQCLTVLTLLPVHCLLGRRGQRWQARKELLQLEDDERHARHRNRCLPPKHAQERVKSWVAKDVALPILEELLIFKKCSTILQCSAQLQIQYRSTKLDTR